MKLSKNFSLSELTKSDKAKELNINNEPTRAEQEKLLYLCLFILQPIRDKFGRVDVTSGFRCPQLNQAIGGAAASQHKYAEASDIRTPEADLREVFVWIREKLTFGQVIYEAPEDGRAPWIHISLPRLGYDNMEALEWDGTNYKLV